MLAERVIEWTKQWKAEGLKGLIAQPLIPTFLPFIPTGWNVGTTWQSFSITASSSPSVASRSSSATFSIREIGLFLKSQDNGLCFTCVQFGTKEPHVVSISHATLLDPVSCSYLSCTRTSTPCIDDFLPYSFRNQNAFGKALFKKGELADDNRADMLPIDLFPS